MGFWVVVREVNQEMRNWEAEECKIEDVCTKDAIMVVFVLV